MKKLFTLCASAVLAFTLSAQAEQPEGTWYFGTGDATNLLNLFSDNGIAMSATIRYAVQDNWIVGGTVSSTDEDNVFDIDVTYFTKGFGFGVSLDNAMEANGEDRVMGFNVGKMVMVGSISDKLYIYPNISIDSDMEHMDSAISFGFRF